MPRFPIGPNGKYSLPRLTREQLRALYDRSPTPEAKELLWEIYRLRRLVLRANQLQRVLTGPYQVHVQLVLDILRDELTGEPCVAEQDEWKADLLGKG